VICGISSALFCGVSHHYFVHLFKELVRQQAACNLQNLGYAILIIPPGVVKRGLSELEMEQSFQDVQAIVSEEYGNHSHDGRVILPDHHGKMVQERPWN